METEKHRLPIFFLVWVFANLAGWTFVSFTHIPAPFYFHGVGCGAIVIVSILQAMVLRRYLDVEPNLWFWSSLLAYTLFFSFHYYGLLPERQPLMIAAIVSLGLAGILQMKTLTPYLHNPQPWIYTSPAAGFLGVLGATLATEGSYPVGSWNLVVILYWAVFGLVYSLVTGLNLMRMADDEQPE